MQVLARSDVGSFDAVEEPPREVESRPRALPAPMPAPAPRVAKVGVLRGAFRRLRHAIVPALLFAPCYAIAVSAAVALQLHWREQDFNTRVLAVLILFLLGALLSGAVSWALAAMIAGNRPWSARFAAMMALLALTTAGLTAFLFFLQYRIYFAQWHGEIFTMLWVFQMLFTGATSVYIFMSSGLKLILPFGLVALFGAALLFARKPRM